LDQICARGRLETKNLGSSISALHSSRVRQKPKRARPSIVVVQSYSEGRVVHNRSM
jgi:hypothetical protein